MASSSVFAAGGGADQQFKGAFRADDVHLTWTTGTSAGSSPAASPEGALVQQAQWSCQRTVNMLYEIGSTNVYYVGNRRQGTATFTRVVTGAAVFKNLVSTFGNLCNPQNMTLDATAATCVSATAGATAGAGVTYTLKDATLNQVGANVSAQEIVINEQLGFMFVDLYYV